jgi:succinate dehydrogenase / fumarate reductase flavoprotein subunit
VYLDFADAINRLGKNVITERYGNLFDMYENLTGENPYETPMRIYPAPHYTMGGLWVDYNLMSTIPGLHVLGEANFSDHGANRLGASALMQGLADGYFVIPNTLGEYLASVKLEKVSTDHEAFKASADDVKKLTGKLLSIKGEKTVGDIHRELGTLMRDKVGMSRDEAGLKETIARIPKLKDEFWNNIKLSGKNEELNKNLEMAGRVADYLELAELMARDALNRNESCGGHLREEYQTEEGEAMRDDENYTYVSVWAYKGDKEPAELHKEKLEFERVKPSQRSYK